MATYIRRREFVVTLGSAAAAWPLAARAQQQAMPVIAYLGTQLPEASSGLLAAFQQGLKQFGYTDGQNVAIEYYGAYQSDRLTAIAIDLVARKVSAIVAVSLPNVLAIKAATTTIPIVFVVGDDPVKFGLVASLNRPGANITGISFLSPAIEAKRVELLHEIAPKASTIAVLVNPKFPAAEVRATAVRGAASALGLHVNVYSASSEDEIETRFTAIAEHGNNALLVTTDPLFFNQRKRLVALAVHHAMPAAYFAREFTEVGGLVSYGTSLPDVYRQAGVYVGRVLKGEKPADLPVLQPTTFELVINLKTAKALGLTLPLTLQVAADEVIE